MDRGKGSHCQGRGFSVKNPFCRLRNMAASGSRKMYQTQDKVKVELFVSQAGLVTSARFVGSGVVSGQSRGFLSSALLWLRGPCGEAPVSPCPASRIYPTISHRGPCWVELKYLIAGRLVKIVKQDRRKKNAFKNKRNWKSVIEPGGFYECSGKITTCHI